MKAENAAPRMRSRTGWLAGTCSDDRLGFRPADFTIACGLAFLIRNLLRWYPLVP
jgi:hypothetical protein